MIDEPALGLISFFGNTNSSWVVLDRNLFRSFVDRVKMLEIVYVALNKSDVPSSQLCLPAPIYCTTVLACQGRFVHFSFP
jgi:hypothetical protein